MKAAVTVIAVARGLLGILILGIAWRLLGSPGLPEVNNLLQQSVHYVVTGSTATNPPTQAQIIALIASPTPSPFAPRTIPPAPTPNPTLAPGVTPSPAPTPTPRPTPIPVPILKTGTLQYDGSAIYGDVFSYRVTIKNAGTGAGAIQFLTNGDVEGTQTFLGCVPACDSASTFGLRIIDFANLKPGKSVTYKIQYQAVTPGRHSASLYLDEDADGIPDASEPDWYFEIVVLT